MMALTTTTGNLEASATPIFSSITVKIFNELRNFIKSGNIITVAQVHLLMVGEDLSSFEET